MSTTKLDNIIDFNKSKEKLIIEKYPNLRKVTKKVAPYYESNKELDKFQKIFIKYQEYVNDKNNNDEVTLEEVFLHFNRYFDAVYNELNYFDEERIKKFKEAIDYSMISSGKRLRPFLMFITYNFCMGQDVLVLTPFMLSMEMIHTFSLVHDDLPCMDNDELRRGKPSVWKKYGDDIATLVGDALMFEASTLLVETIMDLCYTNYGSIVMTSAIIMIRLAGMNGMITGQVFDVMNTGNDKLTLPDINFMYENKTTALIVASLVVGANMAVTVGERLEKIEQLGAYIGEAYQIKDDLLEIESTTEKIGKSVDSDKKNNKITYVSKVGVKASKARLSALTAYSYEVIDELTTDKNVKESKVFKEIINYLLVRDK